MRIVMVAAFPEEPHRIVGGVAGVAKYLADALAAVPGVELTLIVPQGARGGETIRERWGAVEIYRLARRGPWRFLPGTIYDLAAGKRQVEELLTRLSPDLVHYQGTTFLAAGSRRSSVLTIHGIVEKEAEWNGRTAATRWLRKVILKATEEQGRRDCRHVILISDVVAQVLPALDGRRVWRIDNPVADSFFAVARSPERGRILCCSRVRPLKNVDGLIRAFAAVARVMAGARLVVAGAADDGCLRNCRRTAEQEGVGARVEFLGPLSVPEVQRELSRAACLALTSFQETAPLSVTEAMAAGVPVVASRVGGLPQMVEDGLTGLLVDPRDDAAITRALLRLLGDEALAASMSEKARVLANERYRASAVARKTLDVYCEILGAAS